ncbi:jg251, partial [Pararge aegeria aegeria]
MVVIFVTLLVSTSSLLKLIDVTAGHRCFVGFQNPLSWAISFSFFGRTLADNHPRGCYGVTRGVGRARKLAMRRAPGHDDIGGGEVGDVDPRVPPARTR